MSPEQINDPKRVDVRSDIYTLGVVFYEMLAGTRPFDGSPTEIANKHLYSPAPTLKVSGHLAEACTEILGRTLAKNPADRFQSPQELARFASALVSVMQLVVPARTSHALSGRTVLIASVLAGTMLVAGAIIALGAQPGSAGPGATTTTTITPPPVTTTTPRPPTPPLGATWSYSGARDAKTIPLTFSLANIDSRARAIRVVTTIGTTVFSGVATSPSIKSGAATVTFDISGLRSASAYQFSAETYATAADAANAVTSNRLQAQPVIPVLKGLGSRAVSAGGPVGSSGGSVKIVPRPPQART
jgi:serine/threonine protein kinase